MHYKCENQQRIYDNFRYATAGKPRATFKGHVAIGVMFNDIAIINSARNIGHQCIKSFY